MLDKLNTTLRSVPDQLDRAWRNVSGALRRHTFRLDRFQPSSLHDRERIDVIRHRIRAGLNGQRQLVVALVAVVGLSMAVVTANATVGPDANPASAEAVAATDQDRRAAAERADRGERAEPAEAEQTSAGQTGRGAEPQESPSPEVEEPAPDWVHPMPGARTTSCFGQRWGTLHAGVDLAAPHGTPIHAVGAGTVTHSGWVFGGYGISVVIDHGDGHLTHYAHASEAKVSAGDRVEPGDVIALEGSTGDSTGPHLHLEVHKGGLWNAVEPTGWLANRGVEIPGC